MLPFQKILAFLKKRKGVFLAYIYLLRESSKKAVSN